MSKVLAIVRSHISAPAAARWRRWHGGQLVDDAVLVVVNALALRVEVLRELDVVIEPPEAGGGEEQVARAPRAEVLELPDRRGAVERMMAGVASVGGLWKVPGAAGGAELEQGFVALAYDD